MFLENRSFIKIWNKVYVRESSIDAVLWDTNSDSFVVIVGGRELHNVWALHENRKEIRAAYEGLVMKLEMNNNISYSKNLKEKMEESPLAYWDELGQRAITGLENKGITSFEELFKHTQISLLRNNDGFGRKSLEKIQDVIVSYFGEEYKLKLGSFDDKLV